MNQATAVPKILLLLVGIIGVGFSAIYCFFWIFGSMMAGSFGAPAGTPGLFEYALACAPLVTFASYIWIALRPFTRSALVAWGVVAHLPFLRFLPQAQDHVEVFVIVLFLLFATVVYAYFVWSRWNHPAPPQAA